MASSSVVQVHVVPTSRGSQEYDHTIDLDVWGDYYDADDALRAYWKHIGRPAGFLEKHDIAMWKDRRLKVVTSVPTASLRGSETETLLLIPKQKGYLGGGSFGCVFTIDAAPFCGINNLPPDTVVKVFRIGLRDETYKAVMEAQRIYTRSHVAFAAWLERCHIPAAEARARLPHTWWSEDFVAPITTCQHPRLNTNRFPAERREGYDVVYMENAGISLRDYVYDSGCSLLQALRALQNVAKAIQALAVHHKSHTDIRFDNVCVKQIGGQAVALLIDNESVETTPPINSAAAFTQGLVLGVVNKLKHADVAARLDAAVKELTTAVRPERTNPEAALTLYDLYKEWLTRHTRLFASNDPRHADVELVHVNVRVPGNKTFTLDLPATQTEFLMANVMREWNFQSGGTVDQSGYVTLVDGALAPWTVSARDLARKTVEIVPAAAFFHGGGRAKR